MLAGKIMYVVAAMHVMRRAVGSLHLHVSFLVGAEKSTLMLPSMGDTVPHMTQTSVEVLADGRVQLDPFWWINHEVVVKVQGREYIQGAASGAGCNCLIDTLRQQIPQLICNVRAVRRALEDRHRGSGTEIAEGDYLEIRATLARYY